MIKHTLSKIKMGGNPRETCQATVPVFWFIKTTPSFSVWPVTLTQAKPTDNTIHIRINIRNPTNYEQFQTLENP